MLELEEGCQKFREFVVLASPKERAATAIARLSPPAQAVAKAYLDWQGTVRDDKLKAESTPLIELLSLDQHQLEELFDAFLPGLGEAALRTWTRLGNGVYSSFITPRPFRAPRHPELTVHRQLKWFDKLASLSTEVRPEILSAESLAVWAPYTSARRCSFDKDSRDGGHLAGHIGRLLASVIEAGGPTAENVFDTLRLSALGRHPQSMFSAQVAWAFAESSSGEAQQLLEECFFSAATPRERCTVLYAATESESDVLARILERALAENTLLDEAVHRVWYRWFGYDISFMAALPVEAIHEFFGEVVPLMRSPLELHLAAQSDMWPRQALAAWVTAMGDSDLALEQFERLAVHEECRARALAVRLTGALTREAGVPIIERGLTDSELKNAVDALEVLDPWAESFESSDARHRRWDLVHKLARRIDEAPADSDIGGTFAWGRIKSQLARCWQNESLETLDGLLDRRLNGRWLLPKDYVLTDQYSINYFVSRFAVEDSKNQRHYENGFHADQMDRFKSAALSHEQVMTILERSRSAHHLYPADILEIVIRQPAESFRTIVQHLLSDKLAKRRCSGLQMLLQADEERARPCVELVRDFLSKRKHGSRLETQLITQVGARFAPWLADDPQATPTSKLFPELTYSPPFEPVRSDVLALTEATRRFVTSLAEFVAAHEAGIVAAKMQAQDPWTRMQKLSQVHLSDDWGSELDSLWSDWYRSRGPDTRNADGRELMQAAMLSRNIYVERYRLEDDVWADWKARGIDLSELVALQKTVEASREALQPVLTRFLASVIDRLCKLHGDWNHWAYRINVAETICAAVPREVLSQVTSPYNIFEGTFPVEKWLWLPAWQSLAEMPEDLLRRLFRLRTWICQPHPAMHVLWLGVGEVELAAYGRGIATLGDLVRCLMPNTMPAFQYELPASLRYENYRYLRRRYPAAAAEFESFMQRLLKTLVESELTRDPRSPTPLSPLCELVKYAEGSQWFEQVLVATAKKGLTRPKMNITAHRELLSSLLSNLYPAASDDMQQVASRLRELLEKKKVTLEHLIQAAFLAPQWARAIESAIGWAGLWEIGEWFAWHLLSDDGKYSLAAWLSPANEACRRDSELDDRHGRLDIKRFYEEQIKQRFSQSPGVACREWFYQLPNEFTNDQWQTIYAALEGITHPSSFRQVVNMCEALRGTLDRQELFDRLSNATKPQDLKPLGLLPISQGESRTMEVLERMRVLTQYCRRIAKFSKWDYSENEWKLVDQVKELLAVNAGFGSVTQLEWFVESAMAEELEKYEVVEVGPTKLRLAIDAQGTPSLEIVKAGKPLKAIPAAVKKDPACVEQQRLLKSLKTFAVEARKTLEHALVEQLRYDIDDLQQMLAHPILRRMFEGVLLTDGTHIGLLGKDGTSLCGPDGEAALDKSRPVWLVHPLDLRSHGGWMRWRDWLRDRGIVQPLPQVERGYFVASDFLRDGRRVQPIFPPLMRSDQARAILHNRGWEFEFSSDGERRFSSAHVIAHTEFRGIFLRSDVLQLHDVVFEVLDKNNFEIAKHFEDIPEIPFSETMRDLYTAVLGAAMDDEPVDEETRIIDARRAHINAAIQEHRLTNLHWQKTR